MVEKETRRIIFVTGLPGTGKTTSSNKLAEKLQSSVICVDHMYNNITTSLKLPELPEHYTKPSRWTNAIKKEKIIYWDHIKPKTNTIIFEGWTVGNTDERELIKRIFKPQEVIMLILKPPFPVWSKYIVEKFDKYPTELTYARMYEDISTEENTYIVSTREDLYPFYEEYQRTGFTDVKFNCLSLPNVKGLKVLELGCNAGIMSTYLIKQGAKVDGIDNSWIYLEEARKRGVKTIYHNINELDTLPTNDYDIVTAVSVIHYADNIQETIKQCARLTKKLAVFELPITSSTGFVAEYFDTHKRPSKELFIHWCEKYFSSVSCIGESVSPDDSYRLVFHCVK